MSRIQELKTQFPIYKDVPDKELADHVFDKFYKGKMQRDEFDVRAGILPSGDPDPLAESRSGAFSQFTKQAGDVFGVMDELQAAGAFIGSLFRGEGTERAKERAGTELRRERARQKISREEHGIAPELIGGFGTVRAAPAALAGARTLGQRARDFAVAVPGLGGAIGFTRSEGGEGSLLDQTTNRLKGAGESAAASLVAAGALRAAQPVITGTAGLIGRGGRAATRRFVPARQTDQRVDAIIEETARRGGTTPEQLARRIDAQNDFSGRGSGRPAMLADQGVAFQTLGRTVNTFPGRAREIADTQLQDRARNEFTRIVNVAANMLNQNVPRNAQGRVVVQDTIEDLIAQRSRAANVNYTAAFRDQRAFNIDRVLNRMGNIANQARGPAQRDLRAAINLFREGPNGAPVSDLRVFHNAKIALDAMLERNPANARSVDRVTRRNLTRMKRLLLRAVERRNPAYRTARNQFESDSSVQDALQLGREMLRPAGQRNVEISGRTVREMTDSEREMFTLGLLREMQEIVGGKRIGQDITARMQTPNFQDSLRAAFNNSGQYNNFIRQLNQMANRFQTRNTVLSGSQTANKQAEQLDFGNIADQAEDIAQLRSFSGAAMVLVGRAIRQATRMREEDAAEIARLLFSRQDRQVVIPRLRDISRRVGARRLQRALQVARRRVGSLQNAATVAGAESGANREVGPASLEFAP